MGQLGMGAMIRRLAGNEDSVQVLRGALGKTISSLVLKTYDTRDIDALVFHFTDGTAMQLRDEGQSCCETRYMHTDDKLSDFVGAQFLGAGVQVAPSIPTKEYDDEHEIQFLIVKTSIGEFTVETHDVHNGYYGGFAIEASVVAEENT